MTIDIETPNTQAKPTTNGQPITLHNGVCSLTVDPALGGRITAFCVNGENCLSTSAPLTGSTFWPSPQNTWGWPPPAALDTDTYRVARLDEGLLLTSQPCSKTGLVVAKHIEPAAEGFCVTYRMYNATQEPVHYAHWEISRIDGGVTFYASPQAPTEQSTLPVTEAEGAYWHDYQPAGADNNLKLFANESEGWLANVNNNLLLKKTFAKVPTADVAPTEAEIEIYAHGDPVNPYIEIEQQGAYLSIAPGESVDWQVLWQLAVLPSHINCVDRKALLAFARGLSRHLSC